MGPCAAQPRAKSIEFEFYAVIGPVGGGDPQAEHLTLYKEWAQGDWGMIITGRSISLIPADSMLLWLNQSARMFI